MEVLKGDDSPVHRLSEQRIELRAGEYYGREWENLAEFEAVAMLIETLAGEVEIEFHGPSGRNWSKVHGIRLYAGKLTGAVTKLAVRIRATASTTFRLTVAFLKKKEARGALTRLSCKECKTFFHAGINILLASVGLPLLNIDSPLPEHTDIAGMIMKLGEVVHSAGGILPEGVSAFFAGIGDQFWHGLQAFLRLTDHRTEYVDRGLEAGCRAIGCCVETKA